MDPGHMDKVDTNLEIFHLGLMDLVDNIKTYENNVDKVPSLDKLKEILERGYNI